MRTMSLGFIGIAVFLTFTSPSFGQWDPSTWTAPSLPTVQYVGNSLSGFSKQVASWDPTVRGNHSNQVLNATKKHVATWDPTVRGNHGNQVIRGIKKQAASWDPTVRGNHGNQVIRGIKKQASYWDPTVRRHQDPQFPAGGTGRSGPTGRGVSPPKSSGNPLSGNGGPKGNNPSGKPGGNNNGQNNEQQNKPSAYAGWYFFYDTLKPNQTDVRSGPYTTYNSALQARNNLLGYNDNVTAATDPVYYQQLPPTAPAPAPSPPVSSNQGTSGSGSSDSDWSDPDSSDSDSSDSDSSDSDLALTRSPSRGVTRSSDLSHVVRRSVNSLNRTGRASDPRRPVASAPSGS